MKARYLTVALILGIAAAISYAWRMDAYANELAGMRVYTYIQSYDKELAQGAVQAYTFKEAVQKLCSDNGIDIVFSQDGAKSSIYSVNGIQNALLPGGGWYGYVIRGTGYHRPDEFLDITLENGDELVLYYGNANETKIITNFTVLEKGGVVTFGISSAYTLWSKGNDRWEKDRVDERLKDVKIHLILPGGTRKILKTNSLGYATTVIKKMGIYKYYAENYVSNGVPLTVRTKDNFFFYGFRNENRISRAEATAFIVNLFGADHLQNPIPFVDVDSQTDFYSEINAAASAGIISGFGDGTFRPDEPVTHLQLAIMLSMVYNGETDMSAIQRADIPEWAVGVIKPAVYYNLFTDMEINWLDPVPTSILQQLYLQL